MRFGLVAVMFVVLAGRADAQFIKDSAPYARPVTIGGVAHYPASTGWVSRTSTVARLHPVVGSGQRTGHLTNPFTHRARYSETVYNPQIGQFGTLRFRR